MTLSFVPELPKIDPEKGPNLMAGAASPLWLVFGGAAMAGATWWWWSARWREAVNVEALLAPTLTGASPTPEPVELRPSRSFRRRSTPSPKRRSWRRLTRPPRRSPNPRPTPPRP
jgi:hypothetical protein